MFVIINWHECILPIVEENIKISSFCANLQFEQTKILFALITNKKAEVGTAYRYCKEWI